MKFLDKDLLLSLMMRGMCFAAGDSGLADVGGGGGSEPPPVADVDVEPADGGDTDVPDDLDVLNEEDAPVVEKTQAEKDAEAAAAAEAAKTPEQKAAEAAAKAKAATTEQTPEEKEAQLRAEAENRPVTAIRKYLEKNPALKAAVEADKTFQNRIYTDARRSARLAEYTPHFATPEIAAQAAQDLVVLNDFETPWYSDAPEAPAQLLNKFVDADTVRDAQGNPVLDDRGIPKTYGRYTRMMTTYREQGMYPTLISEAEKLAAMPTAQQLDLLGQEIDVDEFKNFVDIMRRIMGDKSAGPQAVTRQTRSSGQRREVSSTEDEEANLSPETKSLLEEARRARTQGQTNADAEQKAFAETTTRAIVDGAKLVLKERVDVAAKAFTEGTRDKILDDAFREISAKAKADTAYQRHLSQLQRAFKGDELKTKLVNAAKLYVKERMPEVVRAKVAEYGKNAIADNAERHATLEQRTDRNKEPRTQGANVRPTARSENQLVMEAEKLTRQLYSRGLRDSELLDVDEDFVKDLRQRIASRS